MTNILLTIIAFLLSIRALLQVVQGKRAFHKWYCAPCDIEYHTDICADDIFVIGEKANELGKNNWELVAILPTDVSGNKCYALFFTRKKIKNYYEES